MGDNLNSDSLVLVVPPEWVEQAKAEFPHVRVVSQQEIYYVPPPSPYNDWLLGPEPTEPLEKLPAKRGGHVRNPKPHHHLIPGAPTGPRQHRRRR